MPTMSEVNELVEVLRNAFENLLPNNKLIKIQKENGHLLKIPSDDARAVFLVGTMILHREGKNRQEWEISYGGGSPSGSGDQYESLLTKSLFMGIELKELIYNHLEVIRTAKKVVKEIYNFDISIGEFEELIQRSVMMYELQEELENTYSFASNFNIDEKNVELIIQKLHINIILHSTSDAISRFEIKANVFSYLTGDETDRVITLPNKLKQPSEFVESMLTEYSLDQHLKNFELQAAFSEEDKTKEMVQVFMDFYNPFNYPFTNYNYYEQLLSANPKIDWSEFLNSFSLTTLKDNLLINPMKVGTPSNYKVDVMLTQSGIYYLRKDGNIGYINAKEFTEIYKNTLK